MTVGVNLQLLSNSDTLRVLNVKTFLPICVVVIPRCNTIEQSIAFKEIEGYTKISVNSSATKFGVKLHLVFTVQLK